VAVALRALLAPAWQRLRVLDLAYVNLEASLVAVEVATLCPKLEALSVSHCEAVDDAAVVALARGPCAGKGGFTETTCGNAYINNSLEDMPPPSQYV
jgi:hypothetical protein